LIRLYLRFVSNSAAPIRLYLRFLSNSAAAIRLYLRFVSNSAAPIRLYSRFVSNSADPIRLYLRFVSNSAKYYAYSSNSISPTSPQKLKSTYQRQISHLSSSKCFYQLFIQRSIFFKDSFQLLVLCNEVNP